MVIKNIVYRKHNGVNFPFVPLFRVKPTIGGIISVIMCARQSGVSLGFGSERFPAGTHICLVFRDEMERRRIVSRFVRAGIGSGERVFYFADIPEPEDVIRWLESLEIDPAEGGDPSRTGSGCCRYAFDSGSLSVDDATDTYCPDGTFSPDRMCHAVRYAWSDAAAAGYPASRVTGEMSWALKDLPGSERLIEYESEINTVLQTHPITAMCQYDANRFPGALIFRALQVHPYMVMNDQLVKNPYYGQEG